MWSVYSILPSSRPLIYLHVSNLNVLTVMYIPAVPTTPMNLDYIRRQKDCFLHGERPPDFPKGRGEKDFAGVGTPSDVKSPEGKLAMALQE